MNTSCFRESEDAILERSVEEVFLTNAAALAPKSAGATHHDPGLFAGPGRPVYMATCGQS